jgi:hypothetical protein
MRWNPTTNTAAPKNSPGGNVGTKRPAAPPDRPATTAALASTSWFRMPRRRDCQAFRRIHRPGPRTPKSARPPMARARRGLGPHHPAASMRAEAATRSPRATPAVRRACSSSCSSSANRMASSGARVVNPMDRRAPAMVSGRTRPGSYSTRTSSWAMETCTDRTPGRRRTALRTDSTHREQCIPPSLRWSRPTFACMRVRTSKVTLRLPVHWKVKGPLGQEGLGG